jgi:hypothetical protein
LTTNLKIFQKLVFSLIITGWGKYLMLRTEEFCKTVFKFQKMFLSTIDQQLFYARYWITKYKASEESYNFRRNNSIVWEMVEGSNFITSKFVFFRKSKALGGHYFRIFSSLTYMTPNLTLQSSEKYKFWSSNLTFWNLTFWPTLSY